MEQNLEPQRPRIGTEEVRRAADILRRYHAGKRQLEQRIIDNEQFWKLRHWQQMEKTGQGGNPADPQPTSGWLVNCILSKHADAMDCYPEPTVLPREPGDREEAGKLTRILPVILKKNGFKRTYSSAWWYKLKSGCAVYGVFWDAGKLNGLGDISIRRMDLLNLFWEPGVTDIQDSPHFFSTELQDREALEERYPQAKGKADRGGWTLSRYLYDDAVDTSGKVLVVDCGCCNTANSWEIRCCMPRKTTRICGTEGGTTTEGIPLYLTCCFRRRGRRRGTGMWTCASRPRSRSI